MTTADKDMGARIDTTVPHSARMWDYLLGGKDNYPVDRAAGEQILTLFPGLAASARADRAFLRRAVELLTAEAGVRQFLDIGAGLPTAENTHQVAQRLAPESRIVYVDNDALVLTHAQALLTSGPDGATDYVDADIHDPGPILVEAARTLDFTQPVAIMLLGVLNFVIDTDRARAIVRELLAAVPSGSHLVISHPTTAVDAEANQRAVDSWNRRGAAPLTLRSTQQVASFFDGLELLAPGVVSCTRWRPEPAEAEVPLVSQFCGVARKP